MREQEMKTAVVYYSLTGNCDHVAEKIPADRLRIEPVKAYPASGAKKFYWGGKSAMMAEEPALKPYDFHAEDHDCIILGFPVWAFTVAPPLRTFIAENKEALQKRKVAAYACCSGLKGEKALDKLEKILGKPLAARLLLIDPLNGKDQDLEKKLESFLKELK